MSKYKKVTIGNIINGLFDGPHQTPKPAKEGPIFLGIKNITEDGKIDLSDCKYISREDFPKWTKRVVPQEGDLVFTYEATLHRYAIIPKNFECCLGRRVALIRPDVSKVDTRYLFYYFFTDEWRNTVEKKVLKGATVDRIPLTDFESFEVNLPALSVQKKIAEILGSLDDKIELNRRMNATLEQMAMALYKHWFVDNGDEKDVQIGKVEHFAKIIGGGTPKTTNEEYWGGDIPWVSVKDLSDTFVYTTEKSITEKGLNESSTKLIPKRSTIVSARGTIGEMSITGRPMAMNQSCYAFHSEKYPYFTYLSLKSSIDTLKQNSHGSVFNTITKETIQNLDIPFNQEVCSQFEQLVGKWFLQIESNLKEIMALIETRDYLLPRLLSGEIEMKAAEEQVEGVLASG